MDGTLIDSVGIWNTVDEILIRKLTNNENIKVNNIQKIRDEVLAKCKADDIYLEYCKYLKEKYKVPLSSEEIIKLRWSISNEYVRHQVDYKPNAEKLLRLLKENGFILALATTTTNIQLDAYRNYNENIKTKADINEIFSIVLCKDDVKEKKPHLEVHEKIMATLNVLPSECLILEDSLIGVQAGVNAGIEVAVLYDKYSDCDRDAINKLAKYHFNDFAEIISILNQ